MFITKKAHDAAMAAKDAEIASTAFKLHQTEESNARLRQNHVTLGRALNEALSERDALALDAKRYRMGQQRLREANERRHREAAIRRMGDAQREVA